jgi:hypothetical protein
VEEFSRRFQNKLLHDPTVRLRKGMAEGSGPKLVEAVRFLYGIEDRGDLGPEVAGEHNVTGEEDPKEGASEQ